MSHATNTKSSHRQYSARVFTRAAMVCPHCRVKLAEPVEVCSRCDFDLTYCDKAFPFAAPPLSLVIDPTNLLPDGIERELRKAHQKVRKRAPQVDISFCFVRLQTGVAIEEFAFWLHNSAPEADESRAWRLLVVGDLTSGRLTLTSGYALEPFIKSELWEAALQELAACIADEQWKEGLNGFLTDTCVLLTAAWEVAERRRLKNHRRREAQARSAAAEVEEEQQSPSAEAIGEEKETSPPKSKPKGAQDKGEHQEPASKELWKKEESAAS
ncbi:MAG: hypothetical protein VCA37_17935 [Roseibacillus sp.]